MSSTGIWLYGSPAPHILPAAVRDDRCHSWLLGTDGQYHFGAHACCWDELAADSDLVAIPAPRAAA